MLVLGLASFRARDFDVGSGLARARRAHPRRPGRIDAVAGRYRAQEEALTLAHQVKRLVPGYAVYWLREYFGGQLFAPEKRFEPRAV